MRALKIFMPLKLNHKKRNENDIMYVHTVPGPCWSGYETSHVLYGLGMRLSRVLYGLGMRLSRVLYGLGMRLSHVMCCMVWV